MDLTRLNCIWWRHFQGICKLLLKFNAQKKCYSSWEHCVDNVCQGSETLFGGCCQFAHFLGLQESIALNPWQVFCKIIFPSVSEFWVQCIRSLFSCETFFKMGDVVSPSSDKSNFSSIWCNVLTSMFKNLEVGSRRKEEVMDANRIVLLNCIRLKRKLI